MLIFVGFVLWSTYLEPETTIYKLFWLEYLQSLDRKWLFNHFHALRKWLLGVPGTNRLWFQSRDRLFPCLDMSHQTRQLIGDATRIDIEMTITVDCMKWHFPSFPHNLRFQNLWQLLHRTVTRWSLSKVNLPIGGLSTSSPPLAVVKMPGPIGKRCLDAKKKFRSLENHWKPPKTNMDTQNSQNFERRYMFKTIMLGIYVKCRMVNSKALDLQDSHLCTTLRCLSTFPHRVFAVGIRIAQPQPWRPRQGQLLRFTVGLLNAFLVCPPPRSCLSLVARSGLVFSVFPLFSSCVSRFSLRWFRFWFLQLVWFHGLYTNEST